MTAATDFTIADVLEWARTKPADEKYDYQNIRNCALCQFLKETNRAASPIVDMWGDVDDPAPGGWCDGAYGGTYPREMEPALAGNKTMSGDEESWTFGALVERLERLCPEPPVAQSDWARLDAYMADIELVSA